MINAETKAAMHAVKSKQALSFGADSDVVPRAWPWQFSNATKRRVLEATDRCIEPGEIVSRCAARASMR